MSERVEQVIAQLANDGAETAGKLIECGAQLAVTRGMNHPQHRLGLRQIEPSVQHGP